MIHAVSVIESKASAQVAEAGMFVLEQPEKAGRTVLLESSGKLYALEFPSVNVTPVGSVKA